MIAGPYKKIIFKDEYFSHKSKLHGVNHSLRVMTHIWFLCKKIELEQWLPHALGAAFIHDMARKHDGYCTEHGQWAVENKFHRFESLFGKLGLDESGKEIVKDAVTNHSLPEEYPLNHKSYEVTALLKDADALDRIRLGENNLKVDFLRFDQSKHQIGFAKALFEATDKQKIFSFTEILKIALQINQKQKL